MKIRYGVLSLLVCLGTVIAHGEEVNRAEDEIDFGSEESLREPAAIAPKKEALLKGKKAYSGWTDDEPLAVQAAVPVPVRGTEVISTASATPGGSANETSVEEAESAPAAQD